VREFAVEHKRFGVLLGMDPLRRAEDGEGPDFRESMAACYECQLVEWLPEAKTARVVAAHDGRDIASINAFCHAAEGLSKTFVIAMTENGKSICGAYLDPAWRHRAWALDDSKSFLFTLKNHAGVGPRRFPKRGSDSWAAYKSRDYCWRFGVWEGPYTFKGENPGYGGLGCHYEDVVGQGQAIFNGGEGFFRLARWELWQIA
jgi:hypothetical protein